MKKRSLIPFFLFFWGEFSFAQMGGIKGIVLSDKGEPLPFVGIYIKDIHLGTSSNLDSRFEIKLEQGEYTVLFQFLGFKREEKKIRIEDKWVDLNIVLEPTSYVLGEAVIKAKGEDAAYAIMRKAISMSKFYDYQVQEYSAKVYVKGVGQIKKIPWLVNKVMDKKEKIDTGKIYMAENISEVCFKQPNTFREKAISVRSNIPENTPSPMEYINGSFYKPDISGAVSPLSPKAFAYYRFKLEGSFYEGGNQINKIKVIPRSKGDNVFEGSIYIVENLWCIHSLNLTVMKEGITFTVKQLYNEVQEKIWMPSSQNYLIYGSVYGFSFEGKYQTLTNDYKIKLNEKLVAPVEIIDEKTEKEKIPEATRIRSNDEKELENLLQGDKKLTRKDMHKLMKIYEKEEKEEAKKSDSLPIVSDHTVEIDSLANKRDSIYWVESRPIPLTEREIKNYKIKDTIVTSKGAGITITTGTKNDTTRKGNKKAHSVSVGWLLAGRTFKIDSTSSIKWISPLADLNFNTVEGYVVNAKIDYTKRFRKNRSLSVDPVGRYSWARNSFTGKGSIHYRYGGNSSGGSVSVEGGRFISQLNGNDPISFFLNTAYSLSLERNFAKIYEKEYSGIKIYQNISDKIGLIGSAELADRFQLYNNSSAKPILNWENRHYSTNAPFNLESPSTSFPDNRAFITQFDLSLHPWKKYVINNKTKMEAEGSSREIKLSYRKGWDKIMGSDVNFDLAEAGISDHIKWGIRGQLDWGINGGWFFNNSKMYFMDFKHFMGNQTIIQESVTGYRMLNYYKFSTGKYYAETFLHFQTRKFLLTQFPLTRLYGLKENVFLNYLYTPSSKNYTEIGYGLDNIFRFLRFEVVSNFYGTHYQSIGFRIGIAATIGNGLVVQSGN